MRDRLDRLEKKLALLTEAESLAQAGSFELNPHTGEWWVSDGLYRLLGLEPGKAEMTRDRFLAQFVHADDRQFDKEIEQLPLEQRPGQFDCRIVRPDGQVRHVQARIRLIHDAQQRTRILGLLQDVTQQNQADLEQRAFTQRLHEAQKLESLSVLAAGLAHDFNNLLTTVLGYADLADWQLPPGSALRPYLQQIALAARKAAGLCQQLLAYAGKAPLVQEVVNLDRLVREAEPALSALLPDCARLSLNLPPGDSSGSLDDIQVPGDAGLLRQVLLELVSNAAESLGNRPGQVAVRLSRRHLSREELARVQRGSDRPAGDYAVLEIADDGCGMAGETLARIFEPFFTTKFTGRGLGLAAVLGIVQAHRGAVDVESTPGRGSTFHLFLPLSQLVSAGLVVVLDDEPGTRLVLTHMLESAGFQVAPAPADADGLALLDRVRERARMVLFGMDWGDGVAVLEAVRHRQPGLPFIVVGTQQQRDLLPQLPSLADGFLSRPFSLAELLHVVRAALQGGHPQGRSASEGPQARSASEGTK